MIFGNPYEFAVLIEYVPEWSTETFRYGLFHFMLDGKMFPEELVTSTLGVDLRDFLEDSALVSLPENCEIFNMGKEDAFNLMLGLAYPDYRDDIDDPNDFDNFYLYQASTTNIQDSGSYVFCVRCDDIVRIVGAKKQRLLPGPDDRNFWEMIPNPEVVEVFMSVDAVKEIVRKVREYDLATRKKGLKLISSTTPGGADSA
ncbi:immunity 42 family protein [Achromobacter xylosoxidans]|uniref:immunity 42 family protein n=1 Tax=Alcaligenes xylosoxydans xylosoxydans TaxID=85698 RepID=UPI002349F09F|nr:immunity 42 family protein [Achromobacter xylosoxidans]MDC6164367.1 immunity 42 family protein [Achromobacter xylosoxidans]